MSSVSLVSEPIDRCSKIHVMITRMIGYEKKFLVTRVLVGEVAGVDKRTVSKIEDSTMFLGSLMIIIFYFGFLTL